MDRELRKEHSSSLSIIIQCDCQRVRSFRCKIEVILALFRRILFPGNEWFSDPDCDEKLEVRVIHTYPYNDVGMTRVTTRVVCT
jgi:hypothetical protein